ncbi:hypothetical protein LJB99_04030 [Deltaproteobacteria bacterium OttesenSCG-928-K17]|nr:hypothetical protein [Deltaproteobacteria bacterium OttesenSCG-928-K17]
MSDEIFEPRRGDAPPQKIVYKQYPFSKISLCLSVLPGLVVAGPVIAGSYFVWRDVMGDLSWANSFDSSGAAVFTFLLLYCFWLPSFLCLFWLAFSLRPLCLALRGIPALTIDSEGLCDYSSFEAPGRILWRDVAGVGWANEKMNRLLLYLNNPLNLPGPGWNRPALYYQRKLLKKYGTPVRLCGFLLKGGRKTAATDIIMAADIHQPAPDETPPVAIPVSRLKALAGLAFVLLICCVCGYVLIENMQLPADSRDYWEMAKILACLIFVGLLIKGQIKLLLSKRPGLLLNGEGLFYNNPPADFALRWPDITGLARNKSKNTVVIFFRREDGPEDERFEANISSSSLKINSDQLWAMINSAHKKYS